MRRIAELLVLAMVGCSPATDGRATVPAPAPVSDAERTPVVGEESAAPNRGERVTPEPSPEAPPATRVVQLAVDGFSPAVLVLPDRRDAPRPVLIAAHGAGDGPEWQCETWQAIVRGRGFILCPRGVRLNADPGVPSGYFYRNHLTLEREVLAAVAALKRAYPREADTSAIVYTGYSQGATMGVLMLIDHAAQFPRLILVEGGNGDFSQRVAQKYKEKGGVRVLLACGTAHCNGRAQRAAQALNAQTVEARLEHVPGAGHTYGGAVAERVAQAFDWVVAGDPRWDVR